MAMALNPGRPRLRLLPRQGPRLRHRQRQRALQRLSPVLRLRQRYRQLLNVRFGALQLQRQFALAP
jgi:hypothetical protein